MSRRRARHARLGALAAVCVTAALCRLAAAGTADDARFATLERDYALDVLAHDPVLATEIGAAALDPALAALDAQLPDVSPAGIAGEDAGLEHFRARLRAVDPRTLSPERRVDRELAIAQIELSLRAHRAWHTPERALDRYVDEPVRAIDGSLRGFAPVGAGRYGSAEDWRRLIERLRAVPAYLARAEQQLAAGARAGRAPDWRLLRDAGLEGATAKRQYFAVELPRIAYERAGLGNRDAVVWELTPAAARAADAYARLRAFILSTFYVDPSLADENAVKPAFRGDHFALGRADYDWLLHHTLRVESDSAALRAQALGRIASTRAAMVALAREIARAHGWPRYDDGQRTVATSFAALARDAPRSDAEMRRWYGDVAQRLIDYGRFAELFEPPLDYRIEPGATPPAPPLRASGGGHLLIMPTGDDPALLAANNRAALASLAAAAGFPGHDWQYRVMSGESLRIPLVRWLSPGPAEGWSLYAGSLLAEPRPGAPHGFYSAEERLYALRAELQSDLRLRIDIGLHTEDLGVEEAVNALSETGDFLPGSCREASAPEDEVKRASCGRAREDVSAAARSPTRALAVRLDALEIEALRAAASARLGAAFSASRFHLALLREGPVPAAFLHDALLDSLAAEAAQGLPEGEPATTRKLSTK